VIWGTRPVKLWVVTSFGFRSPKKGALCSAETLVPTYKFIRRHQPADHRQYGYTRHTYVHKHMPFFDNASFVHEILNFIISRRNVGTLTLTKGCRMQYTLCYSDNELRLSDRNNYNCGRVGKTVKRLSRISKVPWPNAGWPPTVLLKLFSLFQDKF
jgi:hypothetical protein